MVVFDAAVLTLLLWEGSDAPLDPATQKPVTDAKKRLDHLVHTLQKTKSKILIPTPVLAEVLVEAGAGGSKYVKILQKSAVFEIKDFDALAAIELAEMTRVAIKKGDKKSGEIASWQKIKLDRQIAAIAKVAGAKTLYTDDRALRRFASAAGMQVIGVHELSLPPQDAQLSMHLEVKQQEPEDATEIEEAETEQDSGEEGAPLA
jgi:predicted nucleic acid-binding protein